MQPQRPTMVCAAALLKMCTIINFKAFWFGLNTPPNGYISAVCSCGPVIGIVTWSVDSFGYFLSITRCDFFGGGFYQKILRKKKLIFGVLVKVMFDYRSAQHAWCLSYRDTFGYQYIVETKNGFILNEIRCFGTPTEHFSNCHLCVLIESADS